MLTKNLGHGALVFVQYNVSYERLWQMLKNLKMTRSDMRKLAGLSPCILAKLGRNETVGMMTLAKITSALKCGVDEILEFCPEPAAILKPWPGIRRRGRPKKNATSDGESGGAQGTSKPKPKVPKAPKVAKASKGAQGTSGSSSKGRGKTDEGESKTSTEYRESYYDRLEKGEWNDDQYW